MTNIYSREELAKLISTIPADEINKNNQREAEAVRLAFEEFKDFYGRGYCHLCQGPLNSLDRSKPCSHWLLRPPGFKKTDFPLVYQYFGYFRIDAFLRWSANVEGPLLRNINDLEEEKTAGKILEHTIKYKNLEWSFSCTPSDLTGHPTSIFGKTPHYHFQMRVNDRPFINYSDYHPTFCDEDILKLNMLQYFPDKVILKPMYGAGLQHAIQEIDTEYILNKTNPAEKERELYNIQTMITAKPGQTISGDLIAEIYERSKKEKRTMASIAKELDADVVTNISISNNTPDIAKRKHR